MAIQIESANINEALRLRELRLRALADAPYAFGADYEVESERPIESVSYTHLTLPTKRIV